MAWVGGAGDHLAPTFEASFLGRCSRSATTHDPHRGVGSPFDREVQPHLRLQLALRYHRRDQSSVAVAGDRAVQREADRVDDRGLSRAGRPGQHEVFGVAEINLGVIAEAGEALELEPQGPHAEASS